MSSKRDVSPNYRSAPKVGYPVPEKVRQQNEHDNLIQQLWSMNSQLKERLGEEPSVHSSTTPREHSRGDNQNSFSSNKLKNDEIQRMRNEKLERIRNENNRSRTPEKRPMTPTNVSTDKSNRYNQRDVSPRFHNEKSISDKYRTEPNTSSLRDGSDHSLYHPNNFSQASPRPNNKSKEENYIQLKFFNRAREKDRTEGLLQEAVAEDIRRLANSKKMSENSYKILIRKLENSLNSLVADVDRDGIKSIGFEQLGRMFSQLGIFHIIQYDAESRLINEEQFYSGNPLDQKRRYQEMVVHEEVWNLLAPSEDTEHVSTDTVYAFFRIILDPANLGVSEIARLLQDYIIKGEQNRDAEGVPLENHKLTELIKNLKSMTINRLHYDQTGRLKAAKAEELAQRNDEHTFKPKISDYSQALDKNNMQKFKQQNHLENRNRSKSPIQQNRNKKIEELDEALFSLKGMQKALHGNGNGDTVQMNMRVRTEGDEAFLISEKESETSTVMKDKQDSFLDGRLQMLYKKKEIADKQKEEQRKKQELEAMKDCTFQPAIKNYHTNMHRDPHETVERLYTQHFAKKKKEEQASMEQIEKETLEMDQCTFKPEINNNTVLTPRSVPKGYDKNIMRMRKANDEAQRKKELVEKKSTGENYEKIRNAKIKPPSFLENPRQERNPPFVYIEVGVGGGRTGRIGIHEDDDPRILAKNFAVTFQLNHEMEMNLVDIICQQLDDHFAKLGYENNYE